MADLQSIGNLLQGMGAGFAGFGPQHAQAQAIQQETAFLNDERRRKALIRDFATVYSLGSQGNWDSATKLLENRVQHIQNLKGDPSDTLALLNTIKAGRTDEALSELGAFMQAGIMAGDIELPNGGVRASANTKQYLDGTTVFAQSDGSVRVITPDQREVTGADAQAAIQAAMQNEISYMGDRAGAQAGAREAAALGAAFGKAFNAGRGANEADMGVGGGPSKADVAAQVKRAQEEAAAEGKRNQGVIDLGYDSAKAIPSLRRALALMQQVKTGGVASLSNAVLKTLGIQDANAAEAENLFNAAVLAELRPTFGSQFTVKEGDWLKDINANFGKSVDGNIRLLESGINKASRYANYGMARAIDRDDMRTADEIRDLIGGQPVPRETPRRRSTDQQAPAAIKFLGFE